MPGLSVDRLLPAGFDTFCWDDDCGEARPLPGSLLRCARCRTARYCRRACQAADWRVRHRKECNEVARLAAAARSVVHPSARLSVVAPFSDDVQGLLASDDGILGRPRWRFMRLETNVQGLAEAGCGTATREFLRSVLGNSERDSCIDDLWCAVFSPSDGVPGAVAMAASQDAAGRVIARPFRRSLDLGLARILHRRLRREGLCLVVHRSVPRALRPLWEEARVARCD